MRRPLALILDLDQTLVDSRCSKSLRRAREWGRVRALIPRYELAPGVDRLCRLPGMRIAVVTKSPRPYALSVLGHFRIRFDQLVAFHDARPPKPHPAPTTKALQLLEVDPKDAWAAGDHADDLESARAAGISTLIGVAAWADSVVGLQHARPTVIVSHPAEVADLLQSASGR